jgi:peptidoglycan/LPS O-acetylase OafA/YrhL
MARGGSAGFPDSPAKLFMERGYLGVSFFFMLSGFILTYNYPVIVWKPYLRARAARILPVYYLSLLFSLPLALTVFATYGISLLPITACVLLLSQAWIPPMSSFWNGPAWTLSCEAFFYALLPGLLYWLTPWCEGRPRRMCVLLGGCFAGGLVLPTLFVLKYGADPSANGVLFGPEGESMQLMKLFIERFPLVRLLDFVSGVILCLGVRAHLPKISKAAGPLVVLGILWIMMSLVIPSIFSMGTCCLPGFALLILGASALPFPRPGTSGSALRALASFGLLLGNASYAVYLFHASVTGYLLICDQAWLHALPAGGEAFVWALFLAVTVLTTALSIVIYRFYEEPARRWLGANRPVAR